MFELDPRTVIFINFIYTLCILLFIIAAFSSKRYRFKGFTNWIFAFFLLSLNFLILSLRGIIPVKIVIVIPHILVIWAYIEIKRGLTIFYEVKNRIYTDIIILSVFSVLLLMNKTNAQLRIITLCIAASCVFLDIIILFNSQKDNKQIKTRIISLLFSIAIIVMGIRLILGLQWDPAGNPLESGNNLSTISLLFFITNIIIFFSLYYIVLNKILNERNSLISKIKSISLTDELTGMMNRRGFNRVTNYEMNRFSRTNHGFTFVFCDIDHFKNVNDNYGHDYGDLVLKRISDILQKNLRKGDTAARWGGEEFVIFFPETTLKMAIVALERMKMEIEKFYFEYKGETFNKTMSFGACYCDDPTIEIETVIQKADRNLYAAKDGGRNKIIATKL